MKKKPSNSNTVRAMSTFNDSKYHSPLKLPRFHRTVADSPGLWQGKFKMSLEYLVETWQDDTWADVKGSQRLNLGQTEYQIK